MIVTLLTGHILQTSRTPSSKGKLITIVKDFMLVANKSKSKEKVGEALLRERE